MKTAEKARAAAATISIASAAALGVWSYQLYSSGVPTRFEPPPTNSYWAITVRTPNSSAATAAGSLTCDARVAYTYSRESGVERATYFLTLNGPVAAEVASMGVFVSGGLVPVDRLEGAVAHGDDATARATRVTDRTLKEGRVFPEESITGRDIQVALGSSGGEVTTIDSPSVSARAHRLGTTGVQLILELNRLGSDFATLDGPRTSFSLPGFLGIATDSADPTDQASRFSTGCQESKAGPSEVRMIDGRQEDLAGLQAAGHVDPVLQPLFKTALVDSKYRLDASFPPDPQDTNSLLWHDADATSPQASIVDRQEEIRQTQYSFWAGILLGVVSALALLGIQIFPWIPATNSVRNRSPGASKARGEDRASTGNSVPFTGAVGLDGSVVTSRGIVYVDPRYAGDFFSCTWVRSTAIVRLTNRDIRLISRAATSGPTRSAGRMRPVGGGNTHRRESDGDGRDTATNRPPT